MKRREFLFNAARGLGSAWLASKLKLAGVSARITAIGEYAWDKVGEMGHVVINFNGADTALRPGEITAEEVDLEALARALEPGVEISIES